MKDTRKTYAAQRIEVNGTVVTFDGKYNPEAMEDCVKLLEEVSAKILSIADDEYKQIDTSNAFWQLRNKIESALTKSKL